MRALSVVIAIACLCEPVQDSTLKAPYLTWTASDARRIGRATRVNGRVGGALDLRVVHTERSFNYKLRATWMTKDVIEAAARLQQLTERLTNDETDELVAEAKRAGDIVIMVEIDPREGSGVIPNDWSAFLEPAGRQQGAVRGTNSPSLEKMKALRGVYPRDYNYDVFWVTFPLTLPSGMRVFPSGTTDAILSVRIAGKEGSVRFPVPMELRSH